MREVTLAQWERAKKQGYTAMVEGKPHMLTTVEGETRLEPVHIDKRHQGWVHRRARLAAYKAQQRQGT